ncbi:hypothetical protein LguiA_025773 [Lonicera macranthoides]
MAVPPMVTATLYNFLIQSNPPWEIKGDKLFSAKETHSRSAYRSPPTIAQLLVVFNLQRNYRLNAVEAQTKKIFQWKKPQKQSGSIVDQITSRAHPTHTSRKSRPGYFPSLANESLNDPCSDRSVIQSIVRS